MGQTVGLVSLGCAKNLVDSEQMLWILREKGYTLTNDPAEADIIIVNTCGFIESAKQESIDTLLEMAEYKQSGKCRLLIATGCLSQRYGEALHEEMPELDAVLGVGEYPRLPELLKLAEQGMRPLACKAADRVFEGRRILTTPSYSAYVRTGDGCDNRCAYCAIPLIRGPYRSRPEENVLTEIRQLAAGGTREVTLIAQDTTRFGDDLPGNVSLASLIRKTCAVEGVKWVRALYCYPSRVTEELLDVLASEEKACPYLDLPLQHINAQMLRAMNRTGTPEQIRHILSEARKRNLTLRTTLIVGFPGETDEMFEELLDFVREQRFDRLGAFAFSPEEGTTAAEMPDQIPEEVKQERLDRLMTLQQQISLERNQARVGTCCTVLLEKRTHAGWIGRSMLEAPEEDGKILVHVRRVCHPGDFIQVRITGAQPYDLTGDAVYES